MDSHFYGQLHLAAFGPGRGISSAPEDGLVTLHESAAATATVIGIFMVEDLPDTVPESLRDWTEPLEPPKPKRGRPKKAKS